MGTGSEYVSQYGRNIDQIPVSDKISPQTGMDIFRGEDHDIGQTEFKGIYFRISEFVFWRDQPVFFCDTAKVSITDTAYFICAGDSFGMGCLKIIFIPDFIDVSSFFLMFHNPLGVICFPMRHNNLLKTQYYIMSNWIIPHEKAFDILKRYYFCCQ